MARKCDKHKDLDLLLCDRSSLVAYYLPKHPGVRSSLLAANNPLIYWGEKGFSVRAHLPKGGLGSFVYGGRLVTFSSTLANSLTRATHFLRTNRQG